MTRTSPNSPAIEVVDEKKIEKFLNKMSLANHAIALVVAIITAGSIGYGFYYKTTVTIDEHTKQIESAKKERDELKVELQNTAVYRGANQAEMIEIRERMKRIEDKQDRLLEIVLKQNK